MSANSPPSPSPSQLPPVPASPTYSYASTANPISQYNLPPPPPPRPAHAVLTKADLAHSQAAYADLLASAKAYRLALASLSTAASTFGSALEACARLKEARAELSAAGPPPGAPLSNSFTTAANRAAACTADTLLATAGLQHLVANHQHILSETVYRAFEVPLLHDLDRWRAAVDDEEEGYARALEAQSREIRRLEKEGVKMHRQRRRDVGQLRSHLVELTGKLDALTVLHGDHARTLLGESQEASGRIVEASCSLVRAEVDIFESLARKGWTGGGLEEVLEKGVDLFAAEMDPLGGAGKGGGGGDGGAGVGSSGEGATLFSILPPKSILADTSGADTMRGAKGTRSDSLLVDTDRYQSLAGAVTTSDLGRGRDRDTDSVFSEFNRSRNVRPFSPQPQPLKLNPEDLLGGIEPAAVEVPSNLGKGRRREHDGIEEGDEECAVEDDHEDQDDEEVHPWRNEGLRRDSTDDETKDAVGVSLGDPQQREGTWSDTNDST
ncbi:hypothetical protein F5144DRAFT_492390 [Chaetomium tenue]|uniref:Uncharacterized protein n=1 Tax=Chaetomium tenue TaxID=1854479 RepID=A0ACB7P3X6_9PEZI|nr:hypothetical protein F5144DRAFT_492390 [Chaetomium globosum]